MIFGGLILVGSAGLLIYNLVKTQFYAIETYDGEIEYAEPIRPVQALPAYLNSFTVWNWVIAGFMLIAFGYPIAQFFLMKTYGSSPWGY